MAKGERKSSDRTETDLLYRDEILALMDQCSATSRTGIRNRTLLIFLYRSGLRVGEALALNVSDVDLKARSIRLQETKTGVPQTRGFHRDADDALRRWLDTRKAMGFRGGPLFCTLKGGRMKQQYVRAMMRRLARDAGLDKRAHPHLLRHAYAYELERAGRPATTISELLGHSSVAVTARYLKGLTNHQAIQDLQATDLPPLEFR